ncbi:MAG: nickel pincer cofactor biosynthesis protein LarC [Candidatus Latescibacteria bacterium]|nr:nickel pincer cofactor biosynthesis protein LarC [Candidatus Latescibacterota bacterium]
MKTAYIDCIFGISGDMMLGALVSCGVPVDSLRTELEKLGVNGFELREEPLTASGITAAHVEVVTEHQHEHRHLSHIRDIIESSGLSDRTKNRAIRIFTRLAEAEATVHGTTPEKIHFHEVGALDAIVDVVGACIGLEYLGVERVVSSPIRLGTGTVKCAHGLMPVPVPAVVELTKGVATVRTAYNGEITTPTGAAIVTTLADSWGELVDFVPGSAGYGAGTKKWDDHPNILRITIGETAAANDGFDTDHRLLIETNIDDMNPEVYGYISDRLFDAGALDVFMTPISMKKGRPATLLSVLAEETTSQALVGIMLTETTTIGVRITNVVRKKLKRELRTLDTPFGPVRVKVVTVGGRERITPEYEDCARIARERNVPLISVYESIRGS